MSGADPQITVRAGTAEPVAMELPPGQALGPLSIGRGGTWRVVAAGVLEEHAFLYFNGAELFLQSADANAPVTVNGSPIPGDWTPIYAPCEIAFGSARLWFGPPHQPARSMPPPVPARAPPVPRASAPRAPEMPSPEESTRQVSIEEIQASVRRPPASQAVSATLKSGSQPPPSFGVAPPMVGASSFDAPTMEKAPPVMGPGPQMGAPPPVPSFGGFGVQAEPSFGGFGVPQAEPSFGGFGAAPEAPPPNVAPEAPPAPPPGGIRGMWREASGPKKAMVFLMAPLIWAVWVIFTDKPPPPRPAKPAPSASATASAAPSAGPSSVASTAPSVEPPSTPVVMPTPAPSPSGSPSAKASAGPTTSVKTREREAADAVAVGAYDKAARLYDELAKAHPEVPAYAEAARIMKAKAGKR